jgi:putative membrane protein
MPSAILVWGLVADRYASRCSSACVIVAGAYGAVTVSNTILLVQALPAALAPLFVGLAH